MSWTDRLTRAAFRGFEFLTESHDATGGRRLVVHEFPGAEAPVVEDLGAKTGNYKLNAYFIGPDYDLARNEFLDLLAIPGGAELIHPWLGKLAVRASAWSVRETNKEGGYCTVAVEFVAAGVEWFDVGQYSAFGIKRPYVISPDLSDQAAAAIVALADTAVASYDPDPVSAGGMTTLLARVQGQLDALRQAISLATLPLTWASQVRGLIAGVQGDLAELMAMPGRYAVALRGLAAALGWEADAADLADAARPRAVARLSAQAVAAVSTMPVSTAPAVRVAGAQEGVLRGALLLASAAAVALADYRAAEDRDAVVASLRAAIDALLPVLPDAEFQAAAQVRADVIGALLAQDLKPAVTRDIAGALPATVLAHRLELDEADFLARNRPRHPLFVRGRVHG